MTDNSVGPADRLDQPLRRSRRTRFKAGNSASSRDPNSDSESGEAGECLTKRSRLSSPLEGNGGDTKPHRSMRKRRQPKPALIEEYRTTKIAKRELSGEERDESKSTLV